MQAVLIVMQCVVGTSAYDHAGAFTGNLLDRVKLCQKNFMADRHIYK